RRLKPALARTRWSLSRRAETDGPVSPEMSGDHARQRRRGLRATNRAFVAKPDTENFRCRMQDQGRGPRTIPPPKLRVVPATVSEVWDRLFLFFWLPSLQPFLFQKPPLAPKPLPCQPPSAVSAAQLSQSPL